MGIEVAIIGGALAMAGAGVAAGVAESNALQGQANDLKEIAREEAAAYEKAQALLEKAKDEAITDLETSNLEARGLISSGEAQAIRCFKRIGKRGYRNFKGICSKGGHNICR